jgi:phospholipid-binding lipoprotein MlaA
MFFSKRRFKLFHYFLIIVILSGCSAVQPQEEVNVESPMHPIDSIVKNTVKYEVDVSDPWENINRNTYIFNTHLDRYVMLPAVNIYRDYVPFFLRQGVGNFFDNIASFNHTVNSVLQLNSEETINNGLRFISNSTMGVAGIFDIATDMGLPEIKEDFGQTLGYWGVGNGPYIVLPFFGPSNLRDTSGLVVDSVVTSWLTDDVMGLNGSDEGLALYYMTAGISKRADISFEYYQSGSPFEYETIRWLYTKGRQAAIGHK